jgi:serpin B
MKKVVLLMLAFVLVVLSACAAAEEAPVTETVTPPTVSGETVKAVGKTLASEAQREASPVVSQDNEEFLTDGNNAFAFALYRELKNQEGNLFYSPYSISAALAMAWAGARGETEKQMSDAMHFELTQKDLHPAFNWLDRQLASRGEGAKGKDEQGFRLNVVNAIWGQKDYDFLVSFLDTLAENYGAGLRILDFINEPEESRVTINDWVSEQTEERIQDLIPAGAINSLTRLVLTNAIYFNAAWADQFSESATENGTFNLLSGDTVTVPMMKQRERYNYDRGGDYQAVELPYDGYELSMIILLPDDDEFSKFEDSLDSDKVADIIESFDNREIILTMPRFEYESSFSLKGILSDMGMPVAFSGEADFSGMTGRTDLGISDVVHKAFVSVDENGTEAAAATAVIMAAAAPQPDEPITLTLDRPFIFFIRDIQTGAVLFVGRVVDPS